MQPKWKKVRVLSTGNPTGKRLLGSSSRRWKNNIRMDLKAVGINTGSWVESAYDRDYCRARVNEELNL